MNWKTYNRKRKLRFCNLHLIKDVIFAEDSDMPILDPFDGEMPNELIPFNQALKSKDYHKCVHFFVDDYQFERVWITPEKYIPILKKFKSVIAPDFSVYLDVPKAVNIWNIYRSRLLARYMQEQGIKIIPNISVVPRELEDVVFSGLPNCNIVAISNVQSNGYAYCRNWFRFIRNMIDRLTPQKILVYGNTTTLSSHKDVTYFENENIKRLRLCKMKN